MVTRGKPSVNQRTVPAANFVGTVAANVDNEKMSDADFRQFVRNTLPIVQYDGAKDVAAKTSSGLTFAAVKFMVDNNMRAVQGKGAEFPSAAVAQEMVMQAYCTTKPHLGLAEARAKMDKHFRAIAAAAARVIPGEVIVPEVDIVLGVSSDAVFVPVAATPGSGQTLRRFKTYDGLHRAAVSELSFRVDAKRDDYRPVILHKNGKQEDLYPGERGMPTAQDALRAGIEFLYEESRFERSDLDNFRVVRVSGGNDGSALNSVPVLEFTDSEKERLFEESIHTDTSTFKGRRLAVPTLPGVRSRANDRDADCR